MAKFVLKDEKIFFGGYDVSGILNAINVGYSAELQDDTTFGDDTRSRLAGLKDVSVTLNGYWDSSEDSEFFTKIGAASPTPVGVAPNNPSEGDRAFLFQADEASYAPGATIGEMFAFTLEGQGHGPLVRGLLMENNAAANSSANGTSRVFAAVGAGELMYAGLFVYSASGNSGETLDVTIESDADGVFDSTANTRISFAQITDSVGSEFASVAGAITDTYWRATWTIGGGGTYSFAVILGIATP